MRNFFICIIAVFSGLVFGNLVYKNQPIYWRATAIISLGAYDFDHQVESSSSVAEKIKAFNLANKVSLTAQHIDDYHKNISVRKLVDNRTLIISFTSDSEKSSGLVINTIVNELISEHQVKINRYRELIQNGYEAKQSEIIEMRKINMILNGKRDFKTVYFLNKAINDQAEKADELKARIYEIKDTELVTPVVIQSYKILSSVWACIFFFIILILILILILIRIDFLRLIKSV